MFYTTEDLRNTLLGKSNWTACLQCNTTGVENWNEDGEDVRPGPTSDLDRCTGECENCDGVGFVIMSS